MNQFNFGNNKQRVMRAAIAAAFGLVAAQAGAVNISAGTGVLKVASEIPSTTARLTNGGALDISLTAPAGAVPTTVDPVYIRLNLSNNVKFDGTPTMTCTANSGGGTQTSINAVVQAGGNGFNFVTFQLSNSAGATGSYLSGVCSAGTFGWISGIASAGLVSITVSARTEYKDGASYTTAFLSDKAYITYTPGVSVFASAASAVVVDATSGSDNWASAVTDLTSPTLARLGRYIVTAVGTSAATATLAANASADDIFSGVTVTVSGAALAAALAANTSAGVFLSTAATCATTTGVFSSTGNAGSTVTFTGFAAGTATIGDTGVTVCLNVSGGSAQIATGIVYVGSLGTFATAVTTSLGGMKQLVTITTNGVTKNAYIVHAPTSVAKVTQIWVKNTGATAGNVYATCYAMAGTIVGTANSLLITGLAVNQLVKKTATELFAAIGFSTGFAATDKFSCAFSGALAGMEVVNQTQDVATGAVVPTQAQTN